MKKFHLEITVFISGAAVMAYEVIGSRLLGPYVGTSYVVWTAIIGIILASLSVGYFFGGKLADRRPDVYLLSLLILISGLYILLTSFVKDLLVGFFLRALHDIRIVSIFASLALFTLPSVLLGMVSPFAARLKFSDLSTTGRTVGNLYALSTIGSIAGVFLAGFYLIPSFRISYILRLLSLSLIILSLFLNLINRLTKR